MPLQVASVQGGGDLLSAIADFAGMFAPHRVFLEEEPDLAHRRRLPAIISYLKIYTQIEHCITSFFKEKLN